MLATPRRAPCPPPLVSDLWCLTGARRQSDNHVCDGTCIFHCNGIIIFTDMSFRIAARTTLPQIMSSCSADTAQKRYRRQSHFISVSSCSANTAQKQYRRQSHLISVSSYTAGYAQKQHRKQFPLALQRTKRCYRYFLLAATDTTLLQTISSCIIPLVSAY